MILLFYLNLFKKVIYVTIKIIQDNDYILKQMAYINLLKYQNGKEISNKL